MSLLAIGGTVLLIAGCGDDANSEGDGGDSAAALSKAEFIEKADAICKEGRKEFEREFLAFSKTASAEKVTEDVPKIIDEIFIPAYEGQAKEIDTLGAPSGDEEEIEAFVSAIESGLDEAKEDPLTVFKDNDPLPEATELAEEYGLTGCANSFS